MLEVEVLVFKLHAVDRFTSGAVSAGKISTLGHKAWNDSVEGGALKVKRLALCTHSLLTCAEGTKVFRSLWSL